MHLIVIVALVSVAALTFVSAYAAEQRRTRALVPVRVKQQQRRPIPPSV